MIKHPDFISGEINHLKTWLISYRYLKYI